MIGAKRMAFVAMLVSSGCYDARRPQYASLGLVEVSGTVKLDGEPLPDVMVAFENPEDRTFSFGKTNTAGAYKLMFNSEKPGCTQGKKLVHITPYTQADAEPDSLSKDTKIPTRYGRKSELTAEVDASHRTFDFDLQSK